MAKTLIASRVAGKPAAGSTKKKATGKPVGGSRKPALKSASRKPVYELTGDGGKKKIREHADVYEIAGDGEKKKITLLDGKFIHQASATEKIAVIRQGIRKGTLASIKEKFDLDYDNLATILVASRTVLINKKGENTFGQDISERILALTELYYYGYEVFGDADKFNRWMKKENKALGNKAPMALLDTLYGMQEIKHLIGRIDYGIFS